MDRNVEKETVVLLGLDIVQMGICWSCWSVLGGVGGLCVGGRLGPTPRRNRRPRISNRKVYCILLTFSRCLRLCRL